MEAQPDGKLVVAVTDTAAHDAVVLRRLPDGTAEPTFGAGGTVRLGFGGNETATALTLTPDGMVVVAGQSDCVPAVRRLRPDGSPDTTFAVGGQATIVLDGACRSAVDVVAQPDGKLLVLTGPWLHRLLADGTIDTGFGQAGTIAVATGEPARVIALQGDGRILVGGRDAFGVRRYLSDGSPDSGFGNGGLASIPVVADRYVNDIAIDPNGRIVVGGAIYQRVVSEPIYTDPDGGYLFSLARFTATGQLDTSFGDGGAVQTGFGDIGQSQGGIGAVVRRLTIGADGTLLAAGVDVSDGAFARYLSDGSLDATFGDGGRLDVSFGPYGDHAVAALAGTSTAAVVFLTQTRLARIAEVPAPPTTTSTIPPTTTTTAPTTTTTQPEPPPPPTVPPDRSGYWMVGADGSVYGFGDARSFGNASVGTVTAVDLEPTPSGNGYWVVDDLGRVFAFGNAVQWGSVPPATLARGEKVTSLSATSDGGGYWIFTSRGRLLTFGNAPFLGDVSRVALNGPVLDSIVTPSGQGYYMVASDGGIFDFGDAKFYGSMGGQKLNAAVQSLVPDSDGVGYWLVASDGGIFAFEAGFKGSLGGVKLNKPVTGMVRAGNGYLMVAEDGGIFDFSGDPTSFKGSLGANPPAKPITSVAVLGGR
jgi:uncharacterized delta-60 repeat protein